MPMAVVSPQAEMAVPLPPVPQTPPGPSTSKVGDEPTSRQQRLIDAARSQFQAAFRTRNLSSIRYTLAELQRLGIDVAAEAMALKALEMELDQDRQANWEKNRQGLVQKARAAFKLAYDAKNLQSTRYCL